MGCMLCPRRCGAKRERGELGFCQSPATAHVARAAKHFFEEPPISGTRGSGTVFFTGCSLRCIFCQNGAIRAPESGRAFDAPALAELFLALAGEGVHNINLVTPTHFADTVAAALEIAHPRLGIPVVWNCGGYESPETLKRLEGLIDIYLPDFKYISPELSAQYSAAPDYAEVATAALDLMVRQVGAVSLDEKGMMRRGVIVRHLVLPGARRDSMAVLDRIAETVGVQDVHLSLMSQYTPDFAPADAPAPLRRRVTRFEYESVAEHAVSLGFKGYFQERSAADASYTPDFSAASFPL